ncbi:MAG TPA: hypothetical protein ENK39_09930 [Epsilonproteobacteria bacterium]|nr:hypothetical protein [Campylobacterota bacterium]
MSALQRLQEKIEQWKRDHDEIKRQNADLKSQLAGVAGAHEAKEALSLELENKKSQCQSHEETIASLQQELKEKDEEIEKIIAQVESLLA